MLQNRKIQMLGIAVLIVAALLVSISAVKAPAPAYVPVTGSNSEGLAQYYRSERSAQVANQKGLAIYYQSERGAPLAATNGLAIYQHSERIQPVNWTKSSDPLYKYHQSEWFGK